MAYGNAILAGILGGLGGAAGNIGSSIALQQKEQLEREKLEQERDLRQQIIDAQASQFAQTQAANEAQRFTMLPASLLPAAYQGGQADANGMVKVQVAQMPALTKMREDEVTQGRYGALADYLRGRRGSPATSDAAMSPEGAMYSEQEVLPGAPGRAARPVDPNDLVGLLAGIPGGAELAKVIVPGATQKFVMHGGTAAGAPVVRMNAQTGEYEVIPGSGTVKEPKYTVNTVTTREGVFREVADDQGNVVESRRVGSPVPEPREPREPREPARATATETILDLTRQRQALQRQGVPDTDPRIMDLSGQLESIGGTRYQPKTVAPTARERTDMADMRTTIGSLEQLITNVDANKGILGNVVSNPSGAIRRGLSEYVPSMTTTAEKEFLATLSTQVNQLKTELIGKQRTVPELKDLVDLLPEKGQVDVSVVPRLRAIRTLLQRKLGEREAVFGGGSGPAGAGGGGGGWGTATTVP